MTQTIISLISIVAGILGANIIKSKEFDLTGKTIAGVFGSIFFIKSFGRLGFDPNSIVSSSQSNQLFIVNVLVSFIGGVTAIFIAEKIKHKINSNKK